MEKIWYEVHVLLSDGSTITIDSFDTYDEAEICARNYPAYKMYIDKWIRVGDAIPEIIYN